MTRTVPTASAGAGPTRSGDAAAAPPSSRPGRQQWLAVGVLGVVLAVAPYGLDAYSLDVLTLGLTYGLMAMALGLLLGFTGLPSLGHAAFLGMGGYAAGLLAVHTTDNAVLGLLVAAVVGAAAAAVVGALSLRMHGVFFLMLTLAFAQIVHQVAIRSSFTGGDNGLSVPATEIPLLSATGLPRVVVIYWYVLVVVAVGYVLLTLIVRSPLGQAFVGVRDNRHRMAAIGYSVVSIRMRAVVLSGALTAVGGALLVHKDMLVAPTAIAPDISVLLLVMVLVGGARSVTGALVGAVLLIALRSFTSSWLGEGWVLVEGALFVAVVYFMPSGLAGLAGMLRSRIKRTTA
ncbi:branched-chain amino acid ABC transporter permease [Pseudonocardia sichuanensis]